MRAEEIGLGLHLSPWDRHDPVYGDISPRICVDPPFGNCADSSQESCAMVDDTMCDGLQFPSVSGHGLRRQRDAFPFWPDRVLRFQRAGFLLSRDRARCCRSVVLHRAWLRL